MSIKTSFWVNLILFMGFILTFEPHFTGLSNHEWFTLGGTVVIIIHILMHWDRLSMAITHFFRSLPARVRLNYVIIAFMFTGFIFTIISGLMISERVLPAFGFDFVTDILWRRLHSLASNLTLLLVAVHFALHWDWVKRAFIQSVIDPFRSH